MRTPGRILLACGIVLLAACLWTCAAKDDTEATDTEASAGTVATEGLVPPALGPGEARRLLAASYQISPEKLETRLSSAIKLAGKGSLDEDQAKWAAKLFIMRQQDTFRRFGDDPSSNPALGLSPSGRDGSPLVIASSTVGLLPDRSRSVALLISIDGLSGDPTYPLTTQDFATRHRLCAASIEPYAFRNEPAVVSTLGCTAFLVPGPKLLTARHCLPSYPSVDGLAAVFDYSLTTGATRPLKPEVVRLSGAATGVPSYQGTTDDWALLPLPATWQLNARPLLNFGTSTLNPTDRLYTLHHPLSLPLKFTPDGYQRGQSADGRIQAFIDTFEGSSGAPVFSATTNELIGIIQASQGGASDLGTGQDLSCKVITRCFQADFTFCEPVLVGRLTPETFNPS